MLDILVLLVAALPPDPWWIVVTPHIAPILTALAALVAAIAAVRGAQGKRHRNIQQTQLLAELSQVKQAQADATAQRDRIARQLADEQRKCREEAETLRQQIEKQNEIANELLRLAKPR